MTEATDHLQQRIDAAAARFQQQFDAPPTHAAAAPGRVNLIGEHTDYNDGFVLPMAIDRHTLILARARDDAKVRVGSATVQGTVAFGIDATLKPIEPKWANYVLGVIVGYSERGVRTRGMDLWIDSDVPLGSGLSSSAALELATAAVIESLVGQKLDPVQRALICQRAEHRFAGVPCGIMDQFIISLARLGHALLIDCRSHESRPVPMASDELAVVIANTNVKHDLAEGHYAQRRSECEQAVQAIGRPLRDASLAEVEAAFADHASLPFKRARHVITENQRVQQMAQALQAADHATAGQLMFQSHASLRDDFEVSCPELDTMVSLAEQCAARGQVVGSRMTGGGFGGCTVSLVPSHAAQAFIDWLSTQYHQATGIVPEVFATRPAAGARALTLQCK